MFISAFIFVISAVAVIQFLVQSWRSGLLRVASTEHVVHADDPAARVYRKILDTKDFAEVISYQKVCQDLSGDNKGTLRPVVAYYDLLRGVRALGDAAGFAAAAEWAKQEMAMLTSYAASVVVERLERNQALAAEVRSY
ncbi:MAG TPA: hypothetical protein VMU43_06565 [Candidatus Acidoferrum sp.]|nr:hypothetical protein [Candidatus Acidoferrum sp.]